MRVKDSQITSETLTRCFCLKRIWRKKKKINWKVRIKKAEFFTVDEVIVKPYSDLLRHKRQNTRYVWAEGILFFVPVVLHHSDVLFY